MKILLFSLIFISFNLFALDFNKVTGSFDVAPEKTSEQLVHVTAITGSFEKTDQKYDGRMPASVTTEKKTESIQEVTGSFR